MTRLALPYRHVDAFAELPFSGNQAAVLVLDRWLPDAVLQAVAAEVGFADTAFVVRDATGAADWELRWFAPLAEVRLCGHATLASGHVLLGRSGRDRVTFRTRHAGVLEVRRTPQGCELALPAIATEPAAHPEAVGLLGAVPSEVHRSPLGYSLFVYADEDGVRRLVPDLRSLAALGSEQFICTAPGRARHDVVSRVFVPGVGVGEDSVTGSAHAVLAPYWAPRLGRTAFIAHQASARGGTLRCRIDGERVWLGGRCIDVVEGTFYVSG